MMLRISVALCAIALIPTLPAAHADKWASATVGDITIGYSPDRGLSIRYHGQVVVEGATIQFHDGKWQKLYFGLPGGVRDVQVRDAPEGKEMQILGGPTDDSFAFDYRASARTDGTVRILFSYTLKREQPFSVEYCTVQPSDGPIVGCPFKGIGGAALQEGKVQLEATSGGIDEKTIVASNVKELSIQSRVGKVTFATDGDPWFLLFDGRLRFCGNSLTGWFWGGKLSDTGAVGETRRLDFTVRFEGGPSAPGPDIDVTGKGKPALAVPSVYSPPTQAGLPTLIPEPKETRPAEGSFVVRPDTVVVVRDKPAPEDLRAARDLRGWLKDRYGLSLPLREARQVKNSSGAILLGEPSANPLVAAACKSGDLIDKPEGYSLTVGPQRIVVAGADRPGTYWGVQTLLQLLGPTKDGPEAPAVRIRDWPDFGLRAAHFCLYEHDLAYMTRLVTDFLPRYKFNAVIMEIEGIRWDSHPEWAPKGPTPADVGKLADIARDHFLDPIPQIQSGGHCDYFLFRNGLHKDLAENPDNPYNYCPSNPDTYKVFFDLFAEVQKYLHPRYFHIGHDEFSNDYAICPRCRGKSPAELLAGDVKKLRDWWAERGVPIMMWGDMLLAPVEGPGGSDAFNGGGNLKLADAVPLLPRDVIIADWHYGGEEEFPSFAFWKQHGLRIVAGPWYGLQNIYNLTRAAQKQEAMGIAATTWCGVASEDDAMRGLQYLGSLPYAADCSWSVGKRPPDKLPYDPGERFVSALRPPQARLKGRGFLVDLQPAATRALSDPDGQGWLGYGPGRDLSGVPVGRITLDGTAFQVGPGAVVLAGPLAPAGLPSAVKGIMVGQRASGLLFLNVCGWPVDAGQRIGACVIHFADGTQEEAPLIFGRNIAAYYAHRSLISGGPAWTGKTPGGTALSLYAWEWRNPNPERVVSSVDFLSAGTPAGPALLAITAVAP